VTLSGSAVFSSGTSYQCTANDKSAQKAIQVTTTSGTSFALSGASNSNGEVVGFICIGN
jgi:hypothetical protein